MSSADPRRSDVRRQAEDRFTRIIRRDAEVKAHQKQRSDAEAAKIARLRALRLARDAAAPGAATAKPSRPGGRA